METWKHESNYEMRENKKIRIRRQCIKKIK